MNEETHQKLMQIKRSFRLLMNGPTSQSMSQKGIGYKINWGVPFIELKKMASEYGKDYSLAIELNNPIAKGTAVAFTNFMVFLGSASIQPFVGFLLDTVWNGTMSAGVPLYSASDYKAALVCFPISVLLAFICAFFLRDGKDIDIPMFKEISQSLKGR